MEYTIYLRTNIVNGMKYAGQTCRYSNRNTKWNNLNENYSSKILDEDRKKYGLENFKTEKLAVCNTQEEAWELEKKFIAELDTKYPNGYNMSDGGKGVPNVYITEEHKKIMSEALKDIKRSEEFKQKVSESLKNNPKISNKVYQYTPDGELVKIWESTKECGRNGFDQSRVAEICRGSKRRKMHKGYKWSYKPL